MATKKLFKKKTFKEVKEKEYLLKRDYLWLPIKFADKKIKIRYVGSKNIDSNKLNKIYRAKPYKRIITMARLYVPKKLIGQKIKLRIVG